MASVADAQNEYNKYDVQPNTDGSYTVDGKRLSAAQFKKQKAAAKKSLDDAKKATKKARETAKKETAVVQERKIAQEKTMAGGEQRRAQARTDAAGQIALLEARNRVDALRLAGEKIPAELAKVAGGVSGGLSPEETQARIESRNQEITNLRALVQEPTVAPPTVGAGGTKMVMGPVAGRAGRSSAPVTGAPIETRKQPRPAVLDTKTKTKTKTGKTAKTPAPTTVSADWEAEVRQKFPAFAYYLDGTVPGGQEVAAILRQSVDERWDQNPDGGRAKLDAAIRGTTYWKNTESDAKTFDSLMPGEQNARVQAKATEVKSIIGDSQLPAEAFNAFVRDMTRRNISGTELQNLAYGEIFKSRNEGGYQFVPAVTKAVQSGEAQKLKDLAASYFTTVTDAEIGQYLAGQRTEDDFKTVFKEKAKGQYAHLASQLDTGLSLADITKDYKYYASQVLEKPQDQIDMMKPEFMEAISTTDKNGQFRQLNMGEWITRLRTDDRYGYRYTNGAKEEARNIALNLARAFGGVK